MELFPYQFLPDLHDFSLGKDVLGWPQVDCFIQGSWIVYGFDSVHGYIIFIHIDGCHIFMRNIKCNSAIISIQIYMVWYISKNKKLLYKHLFGCRLLVKPHDPLKEGCFQVGTGHQESNQQSSWQKRR